MQCMVSKKNELNRQAIQKYFNPDKQRDLVWCTLLPSQKKKKQDRGRKEDKWVNIFLDIETFTGTADEQYKFKPYAVGLAYYNPEGVLVEKYFIEEDCIIESINEI